MNIVVCVKQIIDPEIRPEQFKLDEATNRQVRDGLALVVSAYDQNAVEVALRLKEQVGGKITAICLGPIEAQAALKTVMGMGVDGGVLVRDPILGGSDSFGAAHVLACAIRKLGLPDLVLTGCVSGDTGNKMLGPILAEELRWACLPFVSRFEVGDGKVIARQRLSDGYQRVEAALPLVATIVSDDSNVPRYSKLKDIMAAAKKPITTWSAAELGVDPQQVGEGAVLMRLSKAVMPVQEARCEFVTGDTPADKAEKLVMRLRDLNLVG